MPFGVLNVLMLVGLAGVAIPILIHLLNRRRYNVVDWGAMQFLQISEATRRRIMIEELLLMLLRMGLIAILVLALASPFARQPGVLARLAGGGDRDVVLIFDGSVQHGLHRQGPVGPRRRQGMGHRLRQRPVGRRQRVDPPGQAAGGAGPRHADARPGARRATRIAHLPAPAGGCDWPAAVEAAQKILAKNGRARRDVIILSDNQRFGWADDTSLLRWELLANNLREKPEDKTAARLGRQPGARPPRGRRPTGRWPRCAPAGPSPRSGSRSPSAPPWRSAARRSTARRTTCASRWTASRRPPT